MRWSSWWSRLTDAVVGTDVVEVELNPVLVGRRGAVAVDALWLEEIKMTEDSMSNMRDGTAVVTIDRPKANAIDAATSKAMGDAFAALDGDPDVRAIILTGAGPKFFSAGWDLVGRRGLRQRLRRRRVRRVPRAARPHHAGDRSRQRHGGRRRVRDRDGCRPDRRRRPRPVLAARSPHSASCPTPVPCGCPGCCRRTSLARCC